MALKLMRDQLNTLLERLGKTNDGVNHGSEYALYELPSADTLQNALDRYFSQMSTSITPAQPASSWGIRTTAVSDADNTLRTIARRWFYEQEYSPKVDPSVAAETVSDFMTKLLTIVGDSPVFELHVTPPMWCDCVWNDFAFDGGDRHWLLHFGFSD